MKFIDKRISTAPSFGSRSPQPPSYEQPAIHIRYQKPMIDGEYPDTLTLEHVETLWFDTQKLSKAKVVNGQWVEIIFQQAPRWGHYRLMHDLKDGTEPTAVFSWLSYNDLDGVTQDIEVMPLLPEELV